MTKNKKTLTTEDLTLLDYFAAHALHAMSDNDHYNEWLARNAYEIAEEMLKERNKRMKDEITPAVGK